MNSSTRIFRRSHRKACRACAHSSHGWIRCATLPKRTRWPPMCRRRGVDDRAPVEGLEWDAVAVVGMTDGGFPSNKGDNLSVVVDETHLNGFQDGVWTPPEYHENAKTWLTNPAAVPVPVRVDADILRDSPMTRSSAGIHWRPWKRWKMRKSSMMKCSAPCAP